MKATFDDSFTLGEIAGALRHLSRAPRGTATNIHTDFFARAAEAIDTLTAVCATQEEVIRRWAWAHAHTDSFQRKGRTLILRYADGKTAEAAHFLLHNAVEELNGGRLNGPIRRETEESDR